MFKPEEIAAYIGAAAWLPQIVSWAYSKIKKPKIRIIPDITAEIGFTDFGPIFNVRAALFAENNDIIIEKISIKLQHEAGEEHTLQWAGIGEQLSEIKDHIGNIQTISKDQSPIAIKISTQNHLEKLIRFQEPQYHQLNKSLHSALIDQFNFLKKNTPNSFVEEILRSRELDNLNKGRTNYFWWKKGKYRVDIQLSAACDFKFQESTFEFALSDADIELLIQNTTTMEKSIRNTINTNIPNNQPEYIEWKWVYPEIYKTNK